MACNSGFAFTDEKGTLTKIAFSSSSSGPLLTGSSSVESTGLWSAPSFLQAGAPPPSLPQEGQTVRKVRAGSDHRKPHQSQKWKSKTPLKTHLPSYFVVFLVIEMLKVVFKEIWFPKNGRCLTFLGLAIWFDLIQCNKYCMSAYCVQQARNLAQGALVKSTGSGADYL